MTAPFKPLTNAFSVSAQLSADDMPAVAAAGYKSLIINRPDFEEGAMQPRASDVRSGR